VPNTVLEAKVFPDSAGAVPLTGLIRA